MLEELIEVLESFDFEEYGDVRLNSISRLEPLGIELLLHTHIHNGGRQPVNWKISCAGDVYSSFVDPFGRFDPVFLTEHSTLMPYREGSCSVSFNGRPKDPARAFARMCEAQLVLLDDWYDPTHFFNRHVGNSVIQLLETGLGNLAFGPERLMDFFISILEEEGSSASCSHHQVPTVPDAKVLLLGRKSFIVAREFSAAKLD